MSLALALMLAVSLLAGCSLGEKEPEETEAPAPVVYDSYFYFYDYGTGEYLASEVATYQAVTGAECELSALDFSFLEGDYEYVVEGYDEAYGVFLYSYDKTQVEQYRSYLTTVGYLCTSTERYTEGFSYYFTNESNGYMLDIFVAEDETYVAVEPYLNSNPDGETIAEEPVIEEPATEAPATEAPATEPVTASYYYYFYDYSTNEYIYTDIASYQDITGAVCLKSVLDWGFLEEGYEYIVDGYDDQYAMFMYEYDALQLAAYESYLSSRGYEYAGTEQFTQGISYYYKNPDNGYFVDLFVANEDAYLVIEPCINRPE